MFATNGLLGCGRDKERRPKVEETRRGEVAAQGRPVRVNPGGVRLLLAAIFLLSLAAVPAMANAASVETALFGAGHHQKMAPCANYEDMGVLGREGGLLSLLGVGGHRDPMVAAMVTGKTHSIRPVQHESASYVIYVRAECVGSADELLISKNG